MADIAKQTVKTGGEYFRPGDKVEIKDAAERKRLLSLGAIAPEEKPEPKKGKEM